MTMENVNVSPFLDPAFPFKKRPPLSADFVSRMNAIFDAKGLHDGTEVLIDQAPDIWIIIGRDEETGMVDLSCPEKRLAVSGMTSPTRLTIATPLAVQEARAFQEKARSAGRGPVRLIQNLFGVKSKTANP